MDCQATWFLTATPCGSAFVVDSGRRFGSIYQLAQSQSKIALRGRLLNIASHCQTCS